MIAALDAAGVVVGEAELALDEGLAGARVAAPVCAADPAELASAYTAASQRGACPLVLSPLLDAEQRRRVLEAAAGELPEAGHLLCTSGTTGAATVPKLFFFAREAALGNARAHLASLGMRAGDGERVLLPMSMSHSFGLVAAGLGSALLGAPLFAFRATPDPATLLAAAREHAVTTMYLTPPLARLVLRHARRRAPSVPSLRRVSVGSAALSRAELEELATCFPSAHIYFTYGLTELGPRVTTLSDRHDKNPPTPATAGGFFSGASPTPPAPAAGASPSAPIGDPLEGVELEVRDGELFVRSPYATRGRWLGGALHPIAGADGFVATRDAARATAGGIELLGRIDGVIVMGGANVYPEDVEAIADAVPGVAASCLVPRPSPLYGEVPVLVCELEPGFDGGAVARDLGARLRAALPPAHVPVDTLWRALPRTAAGKIARAAVRDGVREDA